MKKVLFANASLVMVSGSTIGSASATSWYGTGNNFGAGWTISPGGNSVYGTGSNFGSGFIIR